MGHSTERVKPCGACFWLPSITVNVPGKAQHVSHGCCAAHKVVRRHLDRYGNHGQIPLEFVRRTNDRLPPLVNAVNSERGAYTAEEAVALVLEVVRQVLARFLAGPRASTGRRCVFLRNLVWVAQKHCPLCASRKFLERKEAQCVEVL